VEGDALLCSTINSSSGFDDLHCKLDDLETLYCLLLSDLDRRGVRIESAMVCASDYETALNTTTVALVSIQDTLAAFEPMEGPASNVSPADQKIPFDHTYGTAGQEAKKESGTTLKTPASTVDSDQMKHLLVLFMFLLLLHRLVLFHGTHYFYRDRLSCHTLIQR